jgi:hypothetical protein
MNWILALSSSVQQVLKNFVLIECAHRYTCFIPPSVSVPSVSVFYPNPPDNVRHCPKTYGPMTWDIARKHETLPENIYSPKTWDITRWHETLLENMRHCPKTYGPKTWDIARWHETLPENICLSQFIFLSHSTPHTFAASRYRSLS